jgi:hypothetical protein
MSMTSECEHCGRPFEAGSTVGRPRKYCRRSCRQRAFESRRHEGDLVWSDKQVVQLSRRLAELEDQVDAVRAVAEELRIELEDGVVPLSPSEVLDRLEPPLASILSGERQGTR